MNLTLADMESCLKWAEMQYKALPFYRLLGERAIELRKRIKYFRKQIILMHGS
jgi:hypothetical protein